MKRLAFALVVLAASVLPYSGADAALADRRVSCPAGTRTAITQAYDTVFNRALDVTADARAGSLSGSDDPSLRALLDAWLADPTSSVSAVVVGDVRCTTRTRAVVDVDLSLSNTSLPRVLPPGRAVRDAGTWKVARDTFCTRMILENPTLARVGPCKGR